MNAATHRLELQHNGHTVGVVRSGAVEVSEACNDEAFFWAGLRALRQVRRGPRMPPGRLVGGNIWVADPYT
jgi:hypothetical protein